MGWLVGAVGIEFASQISKPHRNKALPAAPTINCCQMLPTRFSGYASRISPRYPQSFNGEELVTRVNPPKIFGEPGGLEPPTRCLPFETLNTQCFKRFQPDILATFHRLPRQNPRSTDHWLCRCKKGMNSEVPLFPC